LTYRFPHHVTKWRQAGRDGTEYRCTAKYYMAVLRKPQQVWFYLLIEGPDGYRRELRGDRVIRPIIDRLKEARNERLASS
jgi:hypothetical protein